MNPEEGGVGGVKGDPAQVGVEIREGDASKTSIPRRGQGRVHRANMLSIFLIHKESFKENTKF